MLKALAAMVGFLLLGSTSVFAAQIFLNGVDITSVRNQALKNVTVLIDENGDVMISAPQYRVEEQDSYTPLAAYNSQKKSIPSHKSPAPLEATAKMELAPKAEQNIPVAKAQTASPSPDSLDQAVDEQPAPVTTGH